MKNSNVITLELNGELIEFKLGYKSIKRLKSLHKINLNDFDMGGDFDIEIIGKVLHAACRKNMSFEKLEDLIDELSFVQLTELFHELMGEGAINEEDVKNDNQIPEIETDKKK